MTISKCCGKEVEAEFNGDGYFCLRCRKFCEVVEEQAIDKALNKYEKALDKIQPPTESWEKEFDSKFTYLADWISPERRSNMLFPEKASRAKDFISRLLSQAEARHRENLKKMASDAGQISTITTGYSLEEELLAKYLKE